MNKRILAGVLSLLLFMLGFTRAEAVSYHEGDVEEYIMQQLSAANIPGVSLSIVTSQKEIYSVAFGDVKETSSNLQICALTRTFTTLAVMQLVEKGNINLNDKVSKYIKDTSKNIPYGTTIQELLSYTKPSGNELTLADALEVYNLDIEEGARLPLNTKFNLLGDVIEAVSGTDYTTYIKENIITPLDMQSTYTINEAPGNADITKGCRNYFGLPLKDNIDYKEESYWLGVPSNGIISNVKDIGKYMQMYLSAGGKIISYNTMESIINDNGEYTGKSIFGTDAYYTMGWISTEVEGEKVYYCNGSVENYTSAMFIIPSMDIGVVILFNSADVLTGQKYTDEIEAGAVSLVMGKTAKAVSSNSYLMEHGMADIIYFLAFVCAIMPLLMMEVWVRWTKDKFSIIRLAADILIHIVLPTALIFEISNYIAPWEIIMKAMPDLFFVAAAVIGLFYFGLVVKIIAYPVILLKKGREKEMEEDTEENIEQDNNIYADPDVRNSSWEDNTEEYKEKKDRNKKSKKESKSAEEKEGKEKEVREKKDKLLKRMKDIKEAEKNETVITEPEEAEPEETELEKTELEETELEKTELEETELPTDSITAVEELEEQHKEETTEPGLAEDKEQELTEDKVKTAVKEDFVKKDTIKKDTVKEDIAVKSSRIKQKTEVKPKMQGSLKGRQGQDRPYNKPKRIVLVNDSSTLKNAKRSNSAGSRNNTSRSGNKNSPVNKNKNNRNTSNTANRNKNSYNNHNNRNNSVKENNRNNLK